MVAPAGYGAAYITARTTDGSNRSASCRIESYQWRERWYRVDINTSVRDHIDVGYGSQTQPDNISVKCYLECPGYYNTLVSEYYYPASYDSNGNLSQSYFFYDWGDDEIMMQMQDYRSFRFNCDRDGNYLTEGYCIEGGQYIYYEPL